MNTHDNRKVLLIGWDAADWKAINPLLDAGKMPNLQALLEGGVMGNLATLQPALSPTLWTSIATGKRPYKHGIHGFSEPDPVTGGIRPVTNLSRSTKAIWNILNQEEKNTTTIGWWPSNPAEPLSRGVMVSNDYQTAHGNTYDPEKWPLKPGTVHPERLADKLKQLRFHPAELTEEELRPFLPGLEGMSREELDKAQEDPRMQSLMKIIADCTSIHSAATALLANEPWDLLSVYYDAIDHFGHGFMKYHPPQRKGIDDWDYRLYNHVVEAGYLFHDMMLGTLVSMAREIEPEVTILLISDHGFHPDDLRLSNIPNEPAGPAAEHRQFGIFVANGPGLKKDQRIHGASLIDICPTLLHLFGLPVGEDMDGKALLDIYQNPPSEIDRIPSWDDIPGDHGMHPPDKQISAEDSKAALDQLVALGYIEEPDTDQSKALEQTVRELEYNLAQAWMDGGIYTEAITILESLYERWPFEHRFGFQLASCYHSLGRTADLRRLVSTVIERRLKEAEKAIEQLKELKLDNEENQKAEKELLEKMPDQEKNKFFKERRNLLARARPNLFALQRFEAQADFAEKKYPQALEKLQKLESDFGARISALTLRGECHNRLKNWDEAEKAFLEALAIDPETPAPLLGLARISLSQRDYSTTISYARASAALLYFQPRAHFLIGISHYRLGQIEDAEQALLTCVRQAPLFSAAYRLLGQIAKTHHHDPAGVVFCQQKVKQSRERIVRLKHDRSTGQQQKKSILRGGNERPMPELRTRPEALAGVPEKDIITIVSGLPRSGTSLMMQILEAAGITAFTDGNRQADESNQKGYYEHDQVTSLLKPGQKKSWLSETRGHALKVVAPLLATLPRQVLENSQSAPLHYRVLFMERDLEEILTSQSSMLTTLGKKEPSGDVSKAYLQQVRHAKTWLNGHGISALSINYHDLVHRPQESLPELAHFLGIPDQIPAMLNVIDPTLHRARRESSLTN